MTGAECHKKICKLEGYPGQALFRACDFQLPNDVLVGGMIDVRRLHMDLSSVFFAVLEQMDRVGGEGKNDPKTV